MVIAIIYHIILYLIFVFAILYQTGADHCVSCRGGGVLQECYVMKRGYQLERDKLLHEGGGSKWQFFPLCTFRTMPDTKIIVGDDDDNDDDHNHDDDGGGDECDNVDDNNDDKCDEDD